MSNIKATFSVEAGVALDQFSPVKLATGYLVACTAAADECIGTLEDGTTGSETNDSLRSVNLQGVCGVKVKGDGTAIAVGDRLVPGAAGKAVKSAGTGARREIGEALEASDEDGAIIYCHLFGHKPDFGA